MADSPKYQIYLPVRMRFCGIVAGEHEGQQILRAQFVDPERKSGAGLTLKGIEELIAADHPHPDLRRAATELKEANMQLRTTPQVIDKFRIDPIGDMVFRNRTISAACPSFRLFNPN